MIERRKLRMSFKQLLAIMIVILPVLGTAQDASVLKLQKYSLFKNNQYALGIGIAEKMHPEDRKVLNFWLEKFFGKENFVLVKEISQKKYSEKHYLGFLGSIKIALEFPQMTPVSNQEFSNKLCKKLDCDIALIGEDITHYSFKKNINAKKIFSKTQTMNFVKNSRILEVSKAMPLENKGGLFQQLDYDVVFWGKAAEVITYRKPKAQKNSSIGSFFQKDFQKFKISKKIMEGIKLEHLLKFTNADCAYSMSKESVSFCRGNKMQRYPKPKNFSTDLYLAIQSGHAEVLIDDPRFSEQLSNPLVRDSNADAVYDKKFVRMQSREEKEAYVDHLKERYSKYEWNNYHPNIIVEYYKNYKKIVTVKFDNLSKNHSDNIHELVVESTNPNFFKVYEWRPDNSKNYVGRYEPELRPALQKSIERKLKNQTNLSVALRVESKSVGISHDSSAIRFVERIKSEDITFQNIHVKWWDEKKKWGIKGSYELYKYRYTVTSVSNFQTIILGEMNELNLMGTYRYPKTYSWADKLEVAGGVNKKNFLVHTNASIGDLKLLSFPFEVEATKKYNKFIFNYAASLAWIQDAEARFDGGTTGGDGWGYWYQFNGQISYPLHKNTFFCLGTSVRQGQIKFPSGNAALNELGVYVGVEYLNIDF